jgi:hypothetical protein
MFCKLWLLTRSLHENVEQCAARNLELEGRPRISVIPKAARILCATRSTRSCRGCVALARPREIRTAGIVRCKLLLSPFTFLNYTKWTKYEALEKNAVSEPKMAQLRNLRYRRNYRKAPFYWEIFGLPDDREIGMLVSLAERVGFEPTVRFPAHTLSKRAP